MSTRAGIGARRKWLLLGVAAAVVPAELVGLLLADRFRANWSADFWARPAMVAHVVSAVAAAGGAAVLVWRRPANRCSTVAVLLAVVWAAWFVSVYDWNVPAGGWRALGTLALVFSLRPLLLYLVLAYPVGRLDRVSRRIYLPYLAGTAAVAALSATVYDPKVLPPQQFTVWRMATWSQLTFSAWWDVVSFAVMITVVVIVRRRTLKYPGAGARIAMPAFWAAAVAAGADFLLILTGPLTILSVHEGLLTPVGTAVLLFDYLRFGAVVAILAFGAWRAWPREQATSNEVDLGASHAEDALTQEFAHALGDPSARHRARRQRRDVAHARWRPPGRAGPRTRWSRCWCRTTLPLPRSSTTTRSHRIRRSSRPPPRRSHCSSKRHIRRWLAQDREAQLRRLARRRARDRGRGAQSPGTRPARRRTAGARRPLVARRARGARCGDRGRHRPCRA